MKEGGKMHIFPPNWLKIYKIAQKKPENFSSAARTPLITSNFLWGKNRNQDGRGGQKYDFQI